MLFALSGAIVGRVHFALGTSAALRRKRMFVYWLNWKKSYLLPVNVISASWLLAREARKSGCGRSFGLESFQEFYTATHCRKPLPTWTFLCSLPVPIRSA